jgi:hypothetical protein
MSRKKEGLVRHFEGWELGVIAVVVALLGTLLIAPLRVVPEDVPLPLADERRLADRMRWDGELAARVVPSLERDPARFYDVRAFGDAFRAYGRAESSSDMYEVVRMRKKLLDAVNVARALGDEPLLGVRAYEKQRFLIELAGWEKAEDESEELRGLAGSFLSSARRYGWLAGGKLEMNELVRGIFFEQRWNDLTGLTEAPFALLPDERLAFYRFLFTRPPVDATMVSPTDACFFADEWRLRKLGEIAEIDPSYPQALARGILLYRVGRYPAAAEALRTHLSGAQSGQYALRARNYLAEASARAAAPVPSP